MDLILSPLPAKRLHPSMPVHAVTSGKDNVTLIIATGKWKTFNHIIFPCHMDDALCILDGGSGAMPKEQEILGAFCWSKNDVWLYSDKSVGANPLPLFTQANPLACQLMPHLCLVWSSWNYIKRTAYDEKGVVKAHDPHYSYRLCSGPLQPLPHTPTASKQNMYAVPLSSDPVVNLTKPNFPPEQTG